MGKIKLDFHIHSYHSPDGNMKPMDILENAITNNLDVISVTDHNSTKGGIETRNLAEKKDMPIKVIVGQEVITDSGEIIVLNIEEEIPKHLTLEETLSYGKKGFIIAPHPFDKFRKGIGHAINSVKDEIDAIEVFNSRTIMSNHNKLAKTYAKINNIPGVAGFDSHFAEELGFLTLFLIQKNQSILFLKVLKKEKYLFMVGKLE